MYAIEVQATFCAAHALRIPEGGYEPTHGHNFVVTVKLICQKLDSAQTVVDFHEVERLLDGILASWNNQNLNAIEPFHSRVNPSAERIAEQIGVQMQAAMGQIQETPPISTRGLRVAEVRVTEAPNCLAIWTS